MCACLRVCHCLHRVCQALSTLVLTHPETRPLQIQMGGVLGEGQQGYVMKGDWRGMPVVCKVLKNKGNAADDLDFQNEISVLSHLRHPNLVLFLGACVDEEPKIIVSEYCKKLACHDGISLLWIQGVPI